MIKRIGLAVVLVFLCLPVTLLLYPLPAAGVTAFNNENGGGVMNNPPGGGPQFTLSQTSRLDYIRTYHWNGGRGATPGTIWLEGGPNNLRYGPWQTTASATFWVAQPNAGLPPGTYTVFDSDKSTWSYNSQSGNKGFALVNVTTATLSPENDAADAKTWVKSFVQPQHQVVVINSFNDDVKGPVKAHFGYIPHPAFTVDRPSMRVGEVATARVTSPYPGYTYYFEIIAPGVAWQSTGSGPDFFQFKASGPGTFAVVGKTRPTSAPRSAPPWEWARGTVNVQ
jgi:hypothetical protein